MMIHPMFPHQQIENRLFLNNEFVPSVTGKTFPIYNPATEEFVVDVHEAHEEDVNLAVKYAKAALPAWQETNVNDRVAAMLKLLDVTMAHQDEVTYLDAISIGKAKSLYPYEFDMAYKATKYFCGLAPDIQGVSSLNTPGSIGMTLHQPYGITAGICAWNSPITTFFFKTAPALLMGNVLILKSSEKAPLSYIRIAQLIKENNIFPPGVLQIITGRGPNAGAPLASHMEIRKLSFTGSAPTGKKIKQLAAQSNLKNVTLELGGKSPLIIFPDADLDAAALSGAFAITANAGQGCVAVTRFYVHSSVSEEFLPKIRAATLQLKGKHGDPLGDGVTYQPQADKLQFEHVMRLVESGKKSGAKLFLGGNRISEKGYWVEPTIFVDVPDDAEIMKKEVFGPVLCIATFEDEEDVIARANDTEYGLFASVYTKDISRAFRVAKRLESGQVGINTTAVESFAIDLPFGGVKGSGEGRELSRGGLMEWTEAKSIVIRL